MGKDTSIFDFDGHLESKRSEVKGQEQQSKTTKKFSKLMDDLNKISIKGAGIADVAKRLGKNVGDVIYRYRLLVSEGIVPEGKQLTDPAVELIARMFGKEGPQLEMMNALIKDPLLEKRIADSYANKQEEQDEDEDDEYHSIPYEPSDDNDDYEPKYDFNEQMQGIVDALQEQNEYLERIVEHLSANGAYMHEVASELDALVDEFEYFTSMLEDLTNKRRKKLIKFLG